MPSRSVPGWYLRPVAAASIVVAASVRAAGCRRSGGLGSSGAHSGAPLLAQLGAPGVAPRPAVVCGANWPRGRGAVSAPAPAAGASALGLSPPRRPPRRPSAPPPSALWCLLVGACFRVPPRRSCGGSGELVRGGAPPGWVHGGLSPFLLRRRLWPGSSLVFLRPPCPQPFILAGSLSFAVPVRGVLPCAPPPRRPRWGLRGAQG